MFIIFSYLFRMRLISGLNNRFCNFQVAGITEQVIVWGSERLRICTILANSFNCTRRKCVRAQDSILIPEYLDQFEMMLSPQGGHLNFHYAVRFGFTWNVAESMKILRKFRNSWNPFKNKFPRILISLLTFLGSRPRKSWPHKDWTEKGRNPRRLA